VKHHFPGPLAVEEYLEWTDPDSGVKLTGHVDVLSASAGRFLDLKSGWQDSNHDDQMKAYALLMLQVPVVTVDEVYGMVLSPRLGFTDGKIYDCDEMIYWWRGAVRRLIENRETFSPGAHCTHCPRGATCPAKTALLHQAANWLSNVGELSYDAGRIIDRIKLVEAACELARTVLKAEVAAHGGSLETGDGRELLLVDQERESVRYTPASQNVLINNGFLSDDWERIAKLSKTEIKKVAMEKVPRGQKGKYAERVLDQLRECGAVEKQITQRLEVRRHVGAISNSRDGAGNADRGEAAASSEEG
jgi:hypothetical protein